MRALGALMFIDLQVAPFSPRRLPARSTAWGADRARAALFAKMMASADSAAAASAIPPPCAVGADTLLVEAVMIAEILSENLSAMVCRIA